MRFKIKHGMVVFAENLPWCSKPKCALLIRHFGKVRDQVQAGDDHEYGPADECRFWPAIGMPHDHSLERCRDF